MLEVKSIDVSYGHAKVLHDVSIHLQKGEMIFIVGRNGAGKTTLLRTIAGFMQPTQGEINFLGEDIGGMAAEKVANKGVRFVAQDKKVFADLTVKDNMQLAAHAAKEPLEQAIQRLLSIYPKFSKFLNIKAGGLSGGQREMLLIGRALVGEPKLLLIDEPTEGLAAIVIEDIFRILNEMKEKVSGIIVEQNLSVVARLADRIYIMKEGKIEREVVNPAENFDAAELERYL